MSSRAWVYWLAGALACACGSACGSPIEPLDTAPPGVVFTYPLDGQLDVPTGARIVVTFSDPVVAEALGPCTATTGAFCLVGPDGPVEATPEVVGDGKTVQLAGLELAPGTTYQVVARGELAPTAQNLPASTPLFSFTTRASRARAAAPWLEAVNGGDPATPEAFRPLIETSTIQLVFSEPLDPRTVRLGAGAIELVDESDVPVPATLYAHGIHASIDPAGDLVAGATYQLRLGAELRDLGGQALAPITIPLTPRATRTATPVAQVLRTRAAGEPGPRSSRSGAAPNVIVIDKPLIGRETTELLPSALAAELHDPKALGGPIAFTIRRGQRLSSTGMSIALGGQIPVGLDTGDVVIELLADATGRMYRNPYHAAEQRPENERAPLFVDLSLDVAVFAIDPAGNAVLTQTVLGIQATGTAIATESVLAIETVAAMELGLLGVTRAPANLVLELVTDATASPPAADTVPPAIVATVPAAGDEQLVDAGIELVFDEPVDLARARDGGIRLEDAAGGTVPVAIESHGAAVVLRPLASLGYARSYRVVLAGVTDVAGNAMPMDTLDFTTPALAGTSVPVTALAVHPGAPCALTGATATSPGRCAGSATGDDLYRPFAIATNQPIEVTFSGPLRASSVTHEPACGRGSVRIEELDGAGGCIGAVPGTVISRDRGLAFVPDAPWTPGTRYRLTLVSGGDNSCGAGELCGPSGAASFDPLSGSEGGDGGGPPLVVEYVGAPATGGTFMVAMASPFSDVNGSGFLDGGERTRDENRAALRIVDYTGDIGNASFTGTDCVASTPEKEACMYLLGAMPVDLGEVTTSCPLPGGQSAASCVPVTVSAQAMYATSVTMSATLGVSITTDTGTSVMRVREPGGPVTGYIVDRNGTPTMVAALDLYMDAPDMSILLSSHDLHSKPLSVQLEGPVTFLPDGRIAIALANTADLPVEVKVDAPLGLGGTVKMIVPAGEMKLQLVSPSPRSVSL